MKERSGHASISVDDLLALPALAARRGLAGGQGLDSGPARSNSGQGTRWHEPASMPWTRASLQPSQASQRGRKATRLPVTRLIGEAWWYALSARTVRGPKRRAVGGARTLVGVGPPSQAEQFRGRGERAELPSGVGHQPSLLQVDQAADIGQLGDEGAMLPASRREHVGVVAGEHVGNVRSPAGWCWAGLDGQVVGVMLTRSRFR